MATEVALSPSAVSFSPTGKCFASGGGHFVFPRVKATPTPTPPRGDAPRVAAAGVDPAANPAAPKNVLRMETFALPKQVNGDVGDCKLGRDIVKALQRDGIFYIAMDERTQILSEEAIDANAEFVQQPLEQKLKHVSDLSYSGYIASGEEQTANKSDASEVFTVCKELSMDDARVQAGWPCHGPVPWPSKRFARAMRAYMAQLGDYGDTLLQLIALGMQLPKDTFLDMVKDGWHHMRVLHFPERNCTQGARGIGSHTDYGMLVIAAQDEVGGLFVRRPMDEQRPCNWREGETTAGMYEHDEHWWFVPPKENTLTCFTGDTFQFITNNFLMSTPHKVRLNNRERFALAYFHEPNFQSVFRPLGQSNSAETIHYGTHFTNMFMRCYPDRITTKRIETDGRLLTLEKSRMQADVKSKAFGDKCAYRRRSSCPFTAMEIFL